MGWLELFMLAVSLSMDAFAVSVCKGLSLGRAGAGDYIRVGAWFGGAQAVMPLAGYCMGVGLADIAEQWTHIFSFVMLSAIGLSMLRSAAPDDGGEVSPAGETTAAVMFPLAAATSMDAMAVGVMLAFLKADIFLSAGVIGAVTFVMSAAGLKLGSIFGTRYKYGAELSGGVTLIALGVKMLFSR